jgi:hypothetical protein
MTDTEKIGYPVLEFLNIFAPVGEPASIKDIFHSFEKAFAVAYVWPADNQRDGAGSIGPEPH